ncbi:ABC transporter ATP-binding protein [Acidicapsa ligni]|uniref:ABC transporter ATP-binding protein n=1 Tax=Acidicapsa ligni TaxID=542300 RepID=UPI0021E0A894|nr:ABC transporter ATP-binding protein [Acidicapsa ligni]
MKSTGDTRWLIGWLHPHARFVLFGLASSVAAGAVATADPLFMRHLIDVSLPQKKLADSLVTVLALAICFVGRSALGGMSGLLSFRVAQLLGQDLKVKLLEHMTSLSADWHERTLLGDKLSRIDQDVTQISQFGSELANSVVRAIVFFAVNLVIMFLLNWRMTLLVLPLLPAFLCVRRRFRKLIELRADLAQAEIGKAAGYVTEHLGAVPQIQLLGAEEARVARSVNAWMDVLKAQWAQRRTEIAFSIAVTSVLAFAILLVLGFGAHEYLRGLLSLGGLVAFYAYVTRIFEPVSTAMELYSRTQRMLASARRVREILQTVSSVTDTGTVAEMPVPFVSGLTCDGVSFWYRPGELILDKVSFKIGCQEHVALIGASGSGKSTLARLLARIADPTSGLITLEGRPAADYALQALRRAVCYVPQQPVLFSGTIRDNLLLANPRATTSDLHRIMEVTRLQSVLECLPNGLDTVLGPEAAGLSGGERQRLAIARALLRQPAILVLDESTSALDLPTEQAVLRAVAKCCNGKALVLISHRLRSITWVDRIIVLDTGTVTAQGSHATLYRECALYRDLYESDDDLQSEGDPANIVNAYADLIAQHR